MEDKWFLYYEGNTLYMHRSWTGFCIAQVHFVPEGNGLHAVSAEINRDPEQYAGTDDAADIALIERMVRGMGASQRYLEQRQAGGHAWVTITPPKPP
jgi:8-oxo-dGTP diphosphatase